MQDFLQDFSEFLRLEEVSEQTVKTYAENIRRMIAYIAAKYPGAQFEQDTVKAYMIEDWAKSVKGLKPTTRFLYYTGAARFLDYLYKTQRTSFELSSALPKRVSPEKVYEHHPDERPDKRAYTMEEIRRMLSTQNRSREVTLRNHLLIATLSSTALRIFEALQLNVDDVMNGDGFAMVARKRSHGNKLRVAIPSALKPYAEEYIRFRHEKGEDVCGNSPLFVATTGERLSKRDALKTISSLEKKLGLPTGLHTFRHTALTLASKIADPGTARDIAGQKNLAVTSRYIHTTDEEKLSATEQLAKALSI